MPDEKETTNRPAATKEEVSLELMKFIATTTGLGKGGTTAGFGGAAPKSVDDHVDALLQLYEKCRTAVGK